MLKSEKWQKAVEKMKIDRIGKTHTDESKTKIKESVSKYYENNREKTIEKHREIMSKSRGKKVSQYTIDDKFIANYSSMKEASRKTGCHPDSIRSVINGKTKTAKNFKWKLSE